MRLAQMLSCCVLVGCASVSGSSLSPAQLNAACKAQNFLSENGYLAKIPSNFSNLKLELYDQLNYEMNGKIDYQRLIKDRAGTFSGALLGVSSNAEEFAVFYKPR